MKAREYLERVRRLPAQIKSRKMERDELDALIKTVPVAQLQAVKVQSNREPDVLATQLAKLVDLDNYIGQQIAELSELRREASDRIDGLDNETYKLLLRYRYINDMTFEQIAVEMSYSWRSIMRHHKRALQAFEAKFLKLS